MLRDPAEDSVTGEITTDFSVRSCVPQLNLPPYCQCFRYSSAIVGWACRILAVLLLDFLLIFLLQCES